MRIILMMRLLVILLHLLPSEGNSSLFSYHMFLKDISYEL